MIPLLVNDLLYNTAQCCPCTRDTTTIMSFNNVFRLRAASPPYESTPVSVEITPLPAQQPARPFYFEDSQVVLQVSHSIAMFPSALLTTISLFAGRRREVQNTSLFLNPRVRIFQRLVLAPSTGGPRKCRGFR